MEEWQIKHITQNLDQIIELTTFNSSLKAFLTAKNILSKADVDKLDALQRQNGDLEASRHGYQMLLTRKAAYKVLYEGLNETKQSGAYTILIRVSTELFSKPLTYLGISTELKAFQDVAIEVQGKKFTIHKFFPGADFENLQQIFRDCLTELEFYDNFVTGETTFILANNTLPPKPTYYVQRFLSNRINIDKSLFKAKCLDVFVFKKSIARYELSQIAKPNSTGTSTSQLNNMTCRFIYLSDDEDWAELRKMTKAPIHLINYEADKDTYLLEDSSAPSDILKKLGSRKERVYMSEEEFFQQQLSENCTSSSVCICDTPGMGKTFLLANIARLMADNCAGRIVVFIQLASFVQTSFSASSNTTVKPETSLANVLSYICSRRQTQELLLKLVQAEFLQLQVFFDGFDEIPAKKVEWAKHVFRSLTNNFPKVSLYITSRPHMRQELEENLGVVAYDILPFNQQNQVDFLVQFWKNDKTGSDLLSLQTHATTCLKAVNESVTKNEKEIAGIPLLCQLIAEVADQSFKRKFRDVQFKISGMYQKFFEKKIKLVANGQKEFDYIKMVHFFHALKLLFPTNNFHNDKQFRSKAFEDFLTSPEMLRVGILQNHSNGALEFIHRTFAEYLVAEYFFTKLTAMQKTEEMKSDSMSMLKLFLNCQKTKDYFYNIDYNFLNPVIVSFLNSALVEDQISDELKMQATAFVSYISYEEFMFILCACCQHDLLNLFCLLTQTLTKWDNSRIQECFTNQNSYELLRVCIEESTSQMFQKCIQLLAEVLKLDLEQINTNHMDDTLLQTAVHYANYEALEYFVDRISLQNQYLLENLVQSLKFWKIDDIEKRDNIMLLLLNKDPTLSHETPDILSAHGLDVRLFKILVKFGANLTAANKWNKNCAMYAAKYMSSTDYHELVQFLLTNCKAAYLFVDNEKWKDPLPYIIFIATLLPETLELLLNIPDMDINMKDRDGENLLFSAAKWNKVDYLQQLLNRGLDYKARGMLNRSLLHVAASVGNVKMVHYLLSLELDPNSRDENEWTPLHHAAERSKGLSVVVVLVVNGANVQANNNEGQTALHISANGYPDKEVIKYLIRRGTGVNERDNDGNTPLHLCRKKEARDCLIELGADLHAKNNKGQTTLHTLVQLRGPDKEIFKYLTEKGVGVNDRDNEGNTPLHLCSWKAAKNCLIEMGADIHAKNIEGQTPAEMNPDLWKGSSSHPDTEDETDSD